MASSRTFVIWPADEAGKSKKPSVPSLRLNTCVLEPLVGRAEIAPKLIAVDVLEAMLISLKGELQVFRLTFPIFFFAYVVLVYPSKKHCSFCYVESFPNFST